MQLPCGAILLWREADAKGKLLSQAPYSQLHLSRNFKVVRKGLNFLSFPLNLLQSIQNAPERPNWPRDRLFEEELKQKVENFYIDSNRMISSVTGRGTAAFQTVSLRVTSKMANYDFT